MAISKRTENGVTEVTATGKEKSELIGAFAEVNAVDREKREARHRTEPDRRMKRRDGQSVWVNPEHVEKREKVNGMTLCDAKIVVGMPLGWVGIAEDGRVVYTTPRTTGDWERCFTVRGQSGWAMVSSWARAGDT